MAYFSLSPSTDSVKLNYELFGKLYSKASIRIRDHFYLCAVTIALKNPAFIGPSFEWKAWTQTCSFEFFGFSLSMTSSGIPGTGFSGFSGESGSSQASWELGIESRSKELVGVLSPSDSLLNESSVQ